MDHISKTSAKQKTHFGKQTVLFKISHIHVYRSVFSFFWYRLHMIFTTQHSVMLRKKTTGI